MLLIDDFLCTCYSQCSCQEAVDAAEAVPLGVEDPLPPVNIKEPVEVSDSDEDQCAMPWCRQNAAVKVNRQRVDLLFD